MLINFKHWFDTAENVQACKQSGLRTTMTFQLMFDTSLNRNSGVTVSMFASSVVDRGIEPRSCQTKDYKQQSLTHSTYLSFLIVRTGLKNL